MKNDERYHNFYVKAKVGLLEIALPLNDFIKKNEEGVALDPIEYMPIPEYLKTMNHTVVRTSSDGYFLKGFGFDEEGFDEFRAKAIKMGLVKGVDFIIFSLKQVKIELAKPEWNNEI